MGLWDRGTARFDLATRIGKKSSESDHCHKAQLKISGSRLAGDIPTTINDGLLVSCESCVNVFIERPDDRCEALDQADHISGLGRDGVVGALLIIADFL